MPLVHTNISNGNQILFWTNIPTITYWKKNLIISIWKVQNSTENLSFSPLFRIIHSPCCQYRDEYVKDKHFHQFKWNQQQSSVCSHQVQSPDPTHRPVSHSPITSFYKLPLTPIHLLDPLLVYAPLDVVIGIVSKPCLYDYESTNPTKFLIVKVEFQPQSIFWCLQMLVNFALLHFLVLFL